MNRNILDNQHQHVLDVDDNWFSISFKHKVINSQESSQKGSQKILNLMTQNQTITIRELALEIGISDRAIKKHISNLQIQEKIKRIGPDKGGHWEVLK